MTVLNEAMKESEPVDFAAVIEKIKADIIPGMEVMASRRGNLASDWKVIEDDLRCNKAAAKVFLNQCLRTSEEKRSDFIRTLLGLIEEAGYMPSPDLVDQAQANLRTVPPAAPARQADSRPTLQ